jgi:F plasmid transfer operon, TraF, protein
MSTNTHNSLLLAVISVLAAASPAWAQSPVGTRAAGMAGAFVAVADDATAVYWNPAGVASGSLVSAVIDYGQGEGATDPTQTTVTQKDTAVFAGFSATAVGVAYYRFGAYGSEKDEPVVTGATSREEVRRTVHAVTTSVFGVSLVQSLGDYIVVGATPKFVNVGSSNTFDVDAGVMVAANRFHVGLVGRNLTTPSFDTDGVEEGAELGREVTIGGAWGSGWSGISRVIVAVDGDVMSRATPTGDRRDIAGGVETWWLKQRLGIRGGMRRSTIGEARRIVSGGISAGLTAGLLLEAHVARGQSDENSWSVGLRMAF